MRPSLSLLPLLVGTLFAAPSSPLKFDFGTGAAAAGFTAVTPKMIFEPSRGFGFEPEGQPSAVNRGAEPLTGDFITSTAPFCFTARVPHEGNYRVTVTLGDRAEASTTTIKAELRRLMVEHLRLPAGTIRRVSFVVNTRTPRIAATGAIAAGEVRLKAPRETTQEAWAWDDAITLEFCDTRPAVCAVEIEPVEVPTLFLLGDSTVCDQSKEPYNSWGQMLTRWFTPELAVANHGESGETYRDSIGRRRLDKILSVLRPGDCVMMQFGHNDQKQIAAKTGGPFTTYQAELKRHVDGIRARGGIPIVVSPMERRAFEADGKVRGSLQEYADAARQAARDLGVAFIDLNAMSKALYAALGPERSAAAFAAPGGKVDNTHHNNYGSYELARCIVQAIHEQQLPPARFITGEFTGFDPARPDDLAAFKVPPSGNFTQQRPLGDEANR